MAEVPSIDGRVAGEEAPPGLPRLARDPWTWYAERLPGWAGFFLPIVLTPVPLVVAGLLLPEAMGKVWQVQALSIFALDGAIFLGYCYQLEWWVTLAVLMWMELLLLAWLLRNVEFMRRWAPADRFLRRRETRAAALYNRHAVLRRFHFLGVALVTFLPLNTGIFMGVFVGKLTGLADRLVFGAVYLGTFLWATLVTVVFGYSVGFVLDWLGRFLPALHKVC